MMMHTLEQQTQLDELLNFDYKRPKESRPLARIAALIFVTTFIVAMLPLLNLAGIGGEAFTAQAATPKASAKASATVQLRKAPSTKSDSLGTVKKNAKLSVTAEVFTSGKSAAKSTRWYAVKAGKKSGYIKVNRVKNLKFSKVKGVTTDELNYRKGAGTSMKRAGTLPFGAEVTVCLPARAAGTNDAWYRVQIGGKTYYSSADYIFTSNKVGGTKMKSNKSIAAKLLKNPTKAGEARIVYHLDSDNCSKKIMVFGHGRGRVPQGMAYTGKEYHILFGMEDGQSIVTYSTKGRRIRKAELPFNMGKPNGMTWNPETGLCYIMKGMQTTIYTWNPKTGKFGTAETPYSSSGLSYDRVTHKIYASSLAGLRVYSADGKFTHEKFIKRCTHSGKHYVQDCGAHGGFIFHAISGANKFAANYVDVYRAEDGMYLGSLSVNLGELESVIVDNEGFVELLVNCGGTFTEYIWKTPLNVKDLM